MEPGGIENLQPRVLALAHNRAPFHDLAMEVFRFQASNNPVYARFLQLIGCQSETIASVEEIPFLPIIFFKTLEVKTGNWPAETFFESSGTTGQIRSRHWVQSQSWYHQIAAAIFQQQVTHFENLAILGLLPTYLENPHSSLISMVLALGKKTGNEVQLCGLDFETFGRNLQQARAAGRRILIFSVTYALLKLADKNGYDLSDCIVVETGGMKGLGTGLAKPALLEKVQNRLNIKQLYSEYGMTELLSQAYASPGLYTPGFSMQVLLRNMEDPLEKLRRTGRGAFNVVDLANLATCSFIATDDIGICHPDGRFEVMGRADGAEVRGCNLLFS